MKNITNINDLKGKKCDVLGLGISNLPLIDVLLKAGALISARDKNENHPKKEMLEKKGIKLILGDGYLKNIDGDVIFRSPGIRPDTEEIAKAVRSGAYLTSEMEQFLNLTPAETIGITGSDGKTTTTTLTYLFLSKQLEKENKGAKAYVGGNIGNPLLSQCDKMTSNDYAVLELSSFQLMSVTNPPKIAAITNISPNHLNWHTDMAEYTQAKCNIISKDGLLVLNADNEITAKIAKKRKNNLILFSSSKHSYKDIVQNPRENVKAIYLKDDIITVSDGNTEESIINSKDIKIPGKHNTENYMTAIALTYGRVDFDIYEETAKNFGGVEHRLEFVRELDGVKYYNSSIDSSPTRTAAALSALKGTKTVICGGYDKNIPFAPLAESLCENAKAVVLTGATAKKIRSAILENENFKTSGLEIYEEENFDSAVKKAKSIAKSGESVLLSPACASFDAFKNFEERGNHFKNLVNSFR